MATSSALLAGARVRAADNSSSRVGLETKSSMPAARHLSRSSCIAAAVMAMIVANSPLSPYYNMLIDIPVRISIGTFEIAKPLLLWINDGLMALFFLAVGLELKREIIEGELSHPKKIILPLLGAIGGMVVPGLIYIAFNYKDPVAMNGWAIPTATDIAFALGILMLLGKRVPVALKLFLASLAIFDDIGAIVIIALFYTSELSHSALLVSFAVILLLYLMNKKITLLMTGVDLIDNQHKLFFHLIEELNDILSEGENRAKAILPILDELDLYVIDHLDAEEYLMSSIDYPLLQEHVEVHDYFRDWTNEYKASISEKDQLTKEDISKLNTGIIEWLVVDISIQDVKLANYIKENELEKLV